MTNPTSAGRSRPRRLTALIAATLCTGTLLAGCGDPLPRASAAPAGVHRNDQIQGIAASGGVLVAVGAYGAVLVSTDQGVTWSRSALPGAPALIRVVTTPQGFAALDFHGAVWRTDHSAAQWEAARVPAPDVLLDLACAPDGRLWVVGARGGRLFSADGGRTWEDRSLDEDVQFLNVAFPAGGTGVISGEFGRVLLTRDGGATWTPGGSLGAEFYPLAMAFADERRGTVVGLMGAVLDTEDGGRTWTRSRAPVPAPLTGIAPLPDGGLVVAGAAGTVLRRDSAGWRPVEGGPVADLRAIVTLGRVTIVGGSGTLARLADRQTLRGDTP